MEIATQLQVARTQRRHLIEDSSAVGEARRDTQRLASAHGLDQTSSAKAAIAATELANNIWLHGGGGELLIAQTGTESAPAVELIAIDRGRGMNNVERCLQDGYSTAGTAGTGLGAVRRLASEFDIYSVPQRGTLVVARVGSKAVLRMGAISVPMLGEIECGDSWSLASEPDMTALMVVDGLGHGPFAAQAAQCATGAFAAGPFEGPGSIVGRAHRAMTGTRGAAAACARLQGEGSLQYAGIGNISGALVSGDQSRGLMSHNGTLGVGSPRIQQLEYPRPPHALLVMHSDGISARWNLFDHEGLMSCHPAIIAALLYRDHSRGHDDATVVVVKS
jgi:anti-sigma regulatory factor (Ser/Thr protein kinase)